MPEDQVLKLADMIQQEGRQTRGEIGEVRATVAALAVQVTSMKTIMDSQEWRDTRERVRGLPPMEVCKACQAFILGRAAMGEIQKTTWEKWRTAAAVIGIFLTGGGLTLGVLTLLQKMS